jgi:hypothetical protein
LGWRQQCSACGVTGIWPFIPAAPNFNLITVRINKQREHARAVVDDLIADRERASLAAGRRSARRASKSSRSARRVARAASRREQAPIWALPSTDGTTLYPVRAPHPTLPSPPRRARDPQCASRRARRFPPSDTPRASVLLSSSASQARRRLRRGPARRARRESTRESGSHAARLWKRAARSRRPSALRSLSPRAHLLASGRPLGLRVPSQLDVPRHLRWPPG